MQDVSGRIIYIWQHLTYEGSLKWLWFEILRLCSEDVARQRTCISLKLFDIECTDWLRVSQREKHLQLKRLKLTFRPTLLYNILHYIPGTVLLIYVASARDIPEKTNVDGLYFSFSNLMIFFSTLNTLRGYSIPPPPVHYTVLSLKLSLLQLFICSVILFPHHLYPYSF